MRSPGATDTRSLTRAADAVLEAHDALRAGERLALDDVVVDAVGPGSSFLVGPDDALVPSPALVDVLRSRGRHRSIVGDHAGFVPFLIRRLDPRSPDTAALRALVDALHAGPSDPSAWSVVGADAIFTMFLPGATDLRHLLADVDDPADVVAVQDRCVAAFLDYQAKADARCASVLRALPGGWPRAFDYHGRLVSSVRALTGAPATPDLDQSCRRLAEEIDHGDRSLFYDAKPANFVLARGAVPTEDPMWKVDVDWMLVEAPAVHQGVVALFSHPMHPALGTARRAMSSSIDRLVDAFGPQGADVQQVRSVVLYHLVRNVSAKRESAPERATELEPHLQAAIALFADHPVHRHLASAVAP